MTRYLVNAARTFIFSTALAPPAVAGALAALDLLEEKPRRVAKLAANAAALRAGLTREGFDVGDSTTQIVPLLVGDAELAVRMCEAALGAGCSPRRSARPTVPTMTARLRLAVMATHREEELAAAARTLGAVARSLGIAPRHVAPPVTEAEPALAPVGPDDWMAEPTSPAASPEPRPVPTAACSTSRRPSRSAARPSPTRPSVVP